MKFYDEVANCCQLAKYHLVYQLNFIFFVLVYFVGQLLEKRRTIKKQYGKLFEKKKNRGNIFLSILFQYIDIEFSSHVSFNQPILTILEGENKITNENQLLSKLCTFMYFQSLKSIPAIIRTWWDFDLDRKSSSAVDKFTTKVISPILLDHEINTIISNRVEAEGFQIKANKVNYEVTAIFEKEEAALTMIISLPPSYPLRNATVNCTQKMGVAESQWRKWILSMTTLMATQDGSILDAILLWKSNLEKHFDGIEPCPICFTLSANNQLPNLQCKTCKNKFHNACMYRWIRTSHKTDCPLCKTAFF